MRSRLRLAAILAIVLTGLGTRVSAGGATVLGPGQWLAGRMVSSNGLYHLDYQDDGNLVLYTAANQPYWASGTQGTSVGHAVMQDEGNFVVYDASGTALWSTGTWCSPGASLVLADDGALMVVSAEGWTLWIVDGYIG